MIIRNEIPILEYDESSQEVISPGFGWNGGSLPEKCLFAFLGDVVHEYAEKNDVEVVGTLVTVSHNIDIYVVHEENEDICMVQSPIGAAASTRVLDTLVYCGCNKVIAVGSCGVLANFEENSFIVPTKALRAEGTSYHYLPPSRYIELDEEPVAVLKDTFEKHGLPFETCTTWSTDGFLRETMDMVRYRLEEGCSVVDMECAALAACCRKRGAMFGQFLFTADSLANVDEYDARDFGTGSHEKALLLGLDALRHF
ncbi:MAG: nucleoside phosphorylase [bacterium]|nr:nucleoside phosphorylase [bacterium]